MLGLSYPVLNIGDRVKLKGFSKQHEFYFEATILDFKMETRLSPMWVDRDEHVHVHPMVPELHAVLDNGKTIATVLLEKV